MEESDSSSVQTEYGEVRGPLFLGLGEEDLETVRTHLTVHQFRAGDVLIQQDVWCGQLLIIRDGVVQVSVETSGNATGEVRELPLRRMVGGDILGEMSLITGSPPSATVRALTDGTVWVLTQQDFLQLAFQLPKISHNVNAILSERLRRSNLQKTEVLPQQIIAAVGPDVSLWHEVSRAMAHLTRGAVLFADLTGSRTSEFTLSDLVSGRLNPGVATPGEYRLTVVRGTGGESVDLSTLLGRLSDEYRHVLLAIPVDHPMMSSQLLAYTQRVLVAGPIDRMADIRSTVTVLASGGQDLDLNVVLTGAPAGVTATVANTETFSDRLGVPVRAILPARVETLHSRIDALGRWLVGQRIGLALGAGGAKGWAHLGVLRCLHNVGVPIDCVTGVSVGGIIGGAVAMERSVDWMEKKLDASVSRIVRPALPIHGVLTNRPLGRWLRREIFGETMMEDTAIPLALSAADLNEGGEIVLRRGPLWQAVLATAAIPGIYPAVRIGSHWLVDGGVVNPVPVGTTRMLGANVVIAVDLSVPLAPRHELDDYGPIVRKPPFLVNNILRSRDIMMSVIQAHSVAEPTVLVKPQVAGIGLRNFREGSRFIDAGYEAMELALPVLRHRLPWLNGEA